MANGVLGAAGDYVVKPTVRAISEHRLIATGVVACAGAAWLWRSYYQGQQGVEPPPLELRESCQVIRSTTPLLNQVLEAIQKNVTPSEVQIDKVLEEIDKATRSLAPQTSSDEKAKSFVDDLIKQLGDVRLRVSNLGPESKTKADLNGSIERLQKSIFVDQNQLLRCYLEIQRGKEAGVDLSAFKRLVEEAHVAESTVQRLSSLFFREETINVSELEPAIRVFEKLVNTVFEIFTK
ncbi:MAG: hypothetical protein KDK50_06510 [Chlamydiia bacterium]|nr:hypothetical protein [Chlamydiia bacterium]